MREDRQNLFVIARFVIARFVIAGFVIAGLVSTDFTVISVRLSDVTR